MMNSRSPRSPVMSVLLFCLLLCPAARSQDIAVLSEGQTIYVPAYSHIYSGDREKPIPLTITLSIRNIDPQKQITITQVDYYETQGSHVRSYLPDTVTLDPLESIRYIVPEKDKAGGSGANFMVEWEADGPVNAPLVEAVMIGTQSQQGISFTSRGRPLVQAD